ncbi:hypothetical protein DOE76_14455 [Leifsonia sp. ku-ls]|nr:hypothetical protein DOE76_14455 [Leifsonia sp. ku-ls]
MTAYRAAMHQGTVREFTVDFTSDGKVLRGADNLHDDDDPGIFAVVGFVRDEVKTELADGLRDTDSIIGSSLAIEMLGGWETYTFAVIDAIESLDIPG